LDSIAPDSEPEDRIGLILGGQLELTGILGVGAKSVVYSALDINTHVSYAVKSLSKIGKDSRQLKLQQQEVRLHREANSNPYIVSLLRILDADDCLYLVFEFFPEGDLLPILWNMANLWGMTLWRSVPSCRYLTPSNIATHLESTTETSNLRIFSLRMMDGL
jgi:serine/threonine protein kinase